MTTNRPMWDYESMYQGNEFEDGWFERALIEKALKEGRTTENYALSGYSLKKETTPAEVCDELCRLSGGRIVIHTIPATRSNWEVWYIAAEDALIKFMYMKSGHASAFTVYGNNVERVRQVVTYIRGLVVPVETTGKVYVVVMGGNGPYLQQMGAAGEDFIPDNYRPDVVENYQHVVADLNNSDPCGRIIILDGPPGTGKTHMVRALLNEVKYGKFVLVPSNMISSLGSPNFVNALLNERRNGWPMILIVEDADQAISSRKADNLSEISALLNFSDGIFGSILDIRVVCTTNVEVDDLDEAVLRPGRLCRRIEVGRLDEAQAQAIYARLTNGKGEHVFKGFQTLGVVYAKARGAGAFAPATKKPTRKLGFSMDTETKTMEQAHEQALKELGLQPGDTILTPDGEIVEVTQGGVEKALGGKKTLEAVGPPIQVSPTEVVQTFVRKDNPHIGSDFEAFIEGEDEDLIDEDPEQTPTITITHEDEEEE